MIAWEGRSAGNGFDRTTMDNYIIKLCSPRSRFSSSPDSQTLLSLIASTRFQLPRSRCAPSRDSYQLLCFYFLEDPALFNKHEGLHLRSSPARTAPAWQGLSTLLAHHGGLSKYSWLMDVTNSHKPPALWTSRSQLTPLHLLIPALVPTMAPVTLRSTASQRRAQMPPQP